MDKQHSDHIENRIRQAAEGITTPVTEEAWQKMELLLDKQEKKKRRRGIFWWWYLLIFALVTGSGLWYYSGNQHTGSVTQQQSGIPPGEKTDREHTVPAKPGRGQNNNLPPTPSGNPGVSWPGKNEVLGTSEPEINSKLAPSQSPLLPLSHSTPGRNNARAARKTYRGVNGSSKTAKTATFKAARQSKADPDDPQNTEAGTRPTRANGNNRVTTTPTDAADAGNPDINTPGSDSSFVKNGEPDKKEVPASDSVMIKMAQKKPPKSSGSVNKPGFYLLASYAKDATSIDKITFKTYKPVYGVGVGYRFGNRVSLQTGFNASRKIYRAGPGDYKLRQGTNVRQIIYIDANCYIYEVPLLIRFDLITKQKYNMYAASGLSTYFFKKESYDFHYVNLSGAYRRMPYNYQNNTDYFSVANFSVGAEYKILNRLYIQAEPYIKIPLSGLGEGKVKLTSAGLLAGLRYQPFNRKSKK